MTRTPDRLIETPVVHDVWHKSDLLSDVLSRIRLSGAIFLRGEFSSPWTFDSPDAGELVRLLAPGTQRLILFHIVRDGRAWVGARGERVELEAGDVAVLPHADRHLMGSRPELSDPVPITDLLPPQPWEGVPVCRLHGGGESTGVVCGYLKCDDAPFSTFLRRLPAVFRVRLPQGSASEFVTACMNFVLDEHNHLRQGNAPLMARLPELLLIETLRLYSEHSPEGMHWLLASDDAVLSRALALMHAQPERDWTVAELARCAATSTSVLDERFRRRLGQPPMRYLAEWRMRLAADLLRQTPDKVAAIAQRVGYGSEEAFNRAFRRHLGASPSEWRSKPTSAQARWPAVAAK